MLTLMDIARRLRPAALQVDIAIVREYVEARDEYESLERPGSKLAPRRTVGHGEPAVPRYRNARAALTAALNPET